MSLYVYEAEDPNVLNRACQETDHLLVHSFMIDEAVFLYLNMPYKSPK